MRRSRPPSAAFNSTSVSPTAPDRSPMVENTNGLIRGFFSKVTERRGGPSA